MVTTEESFLEENNNWWDTRKFDSGNIFGEEMANPDMNADIKKLKSLLGEAQGCINDFDPKDVVLDYVSAVERDLDRIWMQVNRNRTEVWRCFDEYEGVLLQMLPIWRVTSKY